MQIVLFAVSLLFVVAIDAKISFILTREADYKIQCDRPDPQEDFYGNLEEVDSDDYYTYFVSNREANRDIISVDQGAIPNLPWVRRRSMLLLNNSFERGRAWMLGQITVEPRNGTNPVCPIGGWAASLSGGVPSRSPVYFVGEYETGGTMVHYRCFTGAILPVPGVICNSAGPHPQSSNLLIVFDNRVAGQLCLSPTAKFPDLCWVQNKFRETVRLAQSASNIIDIPEPAFANARSKRRAGIFRAFIKIFQGVNRRVRTFANRAKNSVVRGVRKITRPRPPIPKKNLIDPMGSSADANTQPTGSSSMPVVPDWVKRLREDFTKRLREGRPDILGPALVRRPELVNGPVSDSEIPEVFERDELSTGKSKREVVEDYTSAIAARYFNGSVDGIETNIVWVTFNSDPSNEDLTIYDKTYIAGFRPSVGDILKLGVDSEMKEGNYRFDFPAYTIMYEMAPEGLTCNKDSTFISIDQTLYTFDFLNGIMSTGPLLSCGIFGKCERSQDCVGDTAMKHVTYKMSETIVNSTKFCLTDKKKCPDQLLEELSQTVIQQANTNMDIEDRIIVEENRDKFENDIQGGVWATLGLSILTTLGLIMGHFKGKGKGAI